MNKFGFVIVYEPLRATRPPMPELLDKAIKGLTEIQDRRFRMWRQGKTCREIALIEGVSIARIRCCITRAKRILEG